jgi:AcrR family transcriptional regulator
VTRPRGRPRSDVDDVVLAAAIELLRELGYAAFTVEAVVARTGVAKTTIYRRWPSKGALAAACIERLVPLAAQPATGSLRGDVRELLLESIALFAGWLGAVLAGLAGDAQHDPALHEVLLRLVAPHRQRYAEAFARAGASEADLRVDLVLGVLWERLLVTHAPLDEGLADRLAALTC